LNLSESAPAERDTQRGTFSIGPNETNANRRTFLPVLALTVLVVIVLFEPLFLDASLLSVDNRIISPFIFNAPKNEPPRRMNIDSIDINAFIMPEAIVSSRRWKAREAPLWNDREVLGQPLHAGMGFVSFYPTSILYLLMDPLRAYAMALALHLVLLGVGTYLLFLKKGLPVAPASFGAVLVMFCGFLTVRFHLGCFIQVASWYPWILLASDALIDHPTPRRTAALALLIGLCLLGGFPQIAMFVLYVSAAAFLIGWFRRSRQFRPLLLGFIAAFLGGLLSAVLILPGAEFLGESTRDVKMSRERYKVKSLESVAAIGAVLPRFFGDPVQEIDFDNPVPKSLENFPTYALTTQDKQNVFTENTFYMGCIPLVLILIALARGVQSNNRFHFFVALIALGIAFGVPVLADAARHLPGISSGIPKRALWIASFSMAWLAASAVASIMRSPSRGQLVTLCVTGLGFVLLGAVSWFPFETWLLPEAGTEDSIWFRESVLTDLRIAGLAGIVLLLSALLLIKSAPVLAAIVLIFGGTLEVAAFARMINPAQDMENQYASTPAIQWLKDRGADKDCRILSFQHSGALPGSVAQIYGLRSLNGYIPITHRRTAELLRALDPEMLLVDERVISALRDENLLCAPLLDLLGVRFVVCSLEGYNVLQPRIEALPELELSYVNKNEVLAIYERKTVLPIAFMVKEVILVDEKDRRLELLTSNTFKPRDLALVEEAPQPMGEETLAQGQVVYRRPSPERIELEVDSPGPGFVVVSETHFPGWEALMDGNPVPLVKTNHAMMGIAVPAGSHGVEIAYRPASFYWGAVLSAAGLLGCVLLFLLGGTYRNKAVRVNGTSDTDSEGGCYEQ
jgi:hypothetical protein